MAKAAGIKNTDPPLWVAWNQALASIRVRFFRQLVTSIGIADLLHYTKTMVNHYVDVTPYFIAAAIYLLMTFGLTKLFTRLEKKFMF